MSAVETTRLVEQEQGRLFGVAYRLLGSVADAEDAVQDTFLRWEQADRATIDSPRGWLTTVLTRHCIDQQRSARVRRESRSGTWLPEPLMQLEGGDVDGLLRLLDPSVVLRGEGGGPIPVAGRPVHGPERVATITEVDVVANPAKLRQPG